jgi:predicted flap endonuclease-1-like 5' DNA nuclease
MTAEVLSDLIGRLDGSVEHHRGYRVNMRALQHWINAARAIDSARPYTGSESWRRNYQPFEPSAVRPNDDHGHDDADNQYGDYMDYTREYSRDFAHSARPIITGNAGITAQDELTSQPTSRTVVAPASQRPSSSTEQQPSARQRRRSSSAPRTRRTSQASREPAQSSRTAGAGQRDLRFYLDRSAQVVDAPSIGPKTAQKLRTVGVVTVDNLLRANAVELAKKLADNRISASKIAKWQAQATLACRIPELRGHDAQILVACGVRTPEQIASSSVDQLWSVVGSFAKTTEGKRIIRGGKAPDRTEVEAWIEWSKNARG